MVVRITLLVVVALAGMLVLALWLVRRAPRRDKRVARSSRCSACGQPSSDAATFCGHCGSPLT